MNSFISRLVYVTALFLFVVAYFFLFFFVGTLV